MFTDVDFEIVGGFDNEKIPMSEEYLIRTTPMFWHCRVVKSVTLFTVFEMEFVEMKYN